MARILVPLPSHGFDPTEAGVPWFYLVRAGHVMTFATPDAAMALADPRMLTGVDLPALWRRSLMAGPAAVACFRELEAAPEFKAPLSYATANARNFDALFLPGGHDKGMRVYLESAKLQALVAEFFAADKPVAAICHGTLLAARSRAAEHSVLWGRKTTGLTRRQELIAWYLTRSRLGDYYRTYATPMADELISYLRAPTDYDPGPGYPIPLRRDSQAKPEIGFAVRDGSYVSARWPGDAWCFARLFQAVLAERAA
jgi:protease I